MSGPRRLFSSLSIALALGISIGGATARGAPAGELPPIESFLNAPSFRQPRLSPDGNFYSVVVATDDTDALITVNLADGSATPVMKSTELRIANYWWKGNARLLLLLEDRRGNREFQTYDLAKRSGDNAGALRGGFIQLVNPLPDDPEHVLISVGAGTGVDLQRYNVRTGASKSLPADSGYIDSWLTNRAGEPLAGLGRFHERWFLRFPQGSGRPWRQVDLDERHPPWFTPFAVAPDQRHVLGFQRGAGDTVGVVAWDPAQDTRETLWQSDEIDPDQFEAWGDDWTSMAAIRSELDRPQLHFLDSADRQLARELDTVLPGTFNSFASSSRDKSRLIIFRTSDRLPGDFYLFDRAAKRLSKLGSSYPGVDASRLAASRYFTCQARDGTRLRGRIHLPVDAVGPCAAILLLSSLSDRSRFGYAPLPQLLASRGYAVVEIDHRGTRGYGERFAAAGDQQVAGAMVDDLIDGLDHLAREKLIQSDRVAIMGLDLGGLLAFQAAARYPERFAALVNFWTPADPDKLGRDDAIFGWYSEKERTAKFGSESVRRKYLRTLDPLVALPLIRAPAFHYYPRLLAQKALSREGDRLAKFVAKQRRTDVLVKGDVAGDAGDFLLHRDTLLRAELRRVYAELFEFLGRTLDGR